MHDSRAATYTCLHCAPRRIDEDCLVRAQESFGASPGVLSSRPAQEVALTTQDSESQTKLTLMVPLQRVSTATKPVGSGHGRCCFDSEVIAWWADIPLATDGIKTLAITARTATLRSKLCLELAFGD